MGNAQRIVYHTDNEKNESQTTKASLVCGFSVTTSYSQFFSHVVYRDDILSHSTFSEAFTNQL